MQIQFSLYGFIIGISIVVASLIIEKKLISERLLFNNFYSVGIVSLFFAVIGARLWHVFTDFHLYKENVLEILAIWHGGLSIIGGVVGGLVGVFLSFFIIADLRIVILDEKKRLLFYILDSATFGLPVGQAIGRLGNYVNQELYGVPTTSYIGIFIDDAHRLTGYEQFEYYHPLFLYELLATGTFAAILQYLYKKGTVLSLRMPKIGSGQLFLIYIFYYSLVRFFLDFIRIDRGQLYFGFFGTNQLFLLGVLIIFFFCYGLNQIFRILKQYV